MWWKVLLLVLIVTAGATGAGWLYLNRLLPECENLILPISDEDSHTTNCTGTERAR